MMVPYSLTHFLMLLVTLLFYIVGCYICYKSGRKVQNAIFVVVTLLCCFGIFFRYGMNLKLNFSNISWDRFAMQMLQVCNFNFILLPLMLIPKNEYARQYSVFFSMFAASTAHISISSSFVNLHWYDLTVLNSWLNHTFAIALPLFMIVSRRTKPQKKYVIPCLLGVFSYFTGVAIISHFLLKEGILMPENSFSFIYDRGKTPGFSFFYKILPYDYFYLYLMLPLLIGFFYILAICFKKYKVYKF